MVFAIEGLLTSRFNSYICAWFVYSRSMDNPIKILSVEDDEFMRIFLRDIFWIHGVKHNYEFQMVENIAKAKELLGHPENKPDIIFLDLMLPDHTGGTLDKEAGFHFLEFLKASAELKNIKVIIFSAYNDKEIKDKAAALGADRFLVKGEYLPQELIKATQDLLVRQ